MAAWNPLSLALDRSAVQPLYQQIVTGVRRLIDFQASRRGARRALWRLSEMQGYVRSASCRRASIATYFGERAPRCTGCDRCG